MDRVECKVIHMLTDLKQAYRYHARSVENDHRRLHRRLSYAFRSNLPEEATPGNGEGSHSG